MDTLIFLSNTRAIGVKTCWCTCWRWYKRLDTYITMLAPWADMTYTTHTLYSNYVCYKGLLLLEEYCDGSW